MEKDKRILESAQSADAALNAQWKDDERIAKSAKSTEERYIAYAIRSKLKTDATGKGPELGR